MATDEETGEKFSGKYIFELEREIDKPYWEKHNAKGFIIDGTFGDEIYKIKASKRDRKTGKHEWTKKESTGYSYGNGKKLDFSERDKTIYPHTAHNIKIFNQAEAKEQEVNQKKRELQDIISNLKQK